MSTAPSHLTVRRVPPALASALSRERKRRKSSLNSTVIGLLSDALGVAAVPEPRSNGLAKLARRWSARDATDFEKATAATRTVDKDLWR